MAKAQAQEPSMEEILASIRRIIADEETAPKGKAAAPELASAPDETISEDDLDKLFASADDTTPAEAEDEDDDVLELTEDLAETAGDPPLVDGLDEGGDLAFADLEPEAEIEPEPEPEPEPAPAPVAARAAAPKPAPAPAPAPKPAPVAAPAAAVEDELAIDSEPLISEATEGFVSSAFADLSLTVLNRNARTIEDLVQDMLRPMLKTWLDQNLPRMVERLVRSEIERVTRGR